MPPLYLFFNKYFFLSNIPLTSNPGAPSYHWRGHIIWSPSL